MLPCNARGGACPVEGDLPLFGFSAIMFNEYSHANRQPAVLSTVEENMLMANREQNPCNKQQLEGAEPQLGASSQPSPSLPPRTNVLHGCEECR